jgi:hypothetical protein
MTATISTYLLNRMLDSEYGGTAATPVATFYYALMTTLPAADGTGGVEVTGNNYSRASLANNSTNFPAASGGVKTGAVGAATFPVPSGAWNGIVGICEFDAPSGGNMRRFIAISPYSAQSGASPIQVKATDITITITST